MIIIERFECGATQRYRPSPPSDQDRHVMSMSIRSPSFDCHLLCRCPSTQHASARANIALVLQITARSYSFIPDAIIATRHLNPFHPTIGSPPALFYPGRGSLGA
jgi:hypothetical protein